MEVRLKSFYTVKPEEATWEGTLPLSELDQIGSIGHVPHLYFYKPPQNWLTPSNNTITITNILKQSLSRVLVPFYPLAGRLQSIGRGRFHLNCNSKGVTFIEAESESNIKPYKFEATTSPEYSNQQLVPAVDYTTTPFHEQPLLLVQLTTFPCCGIISLGFAISHAVVDGRSAFYFFSEWARLARGHEQLGTLPFLDRKAAFQAGDPPISSPCFDHPEFDPPPPLLGDQSDSTTKKKKKKKSIGAILKLSKEQVDQLKKTANEGRDHTNIIKAYTRYECLVGYIWRCACKARKHVKEQPTGLAICVDSRSRMRPPLPDEYFGNAVLDVIATSNSGELVSKPVGYAASRVREAIEKVTDEYVWSAINYMKNQPDLTKFQDGPTSESTSSGTSTTTSDDEEFVYGNPNLFVVSWLDLKIYGLDFGWGKEIYFDPGTYEHFDGVSYILPSSTGDGSLIVAVDFQVDHMETFKLHFHRDINNFKARI